ncbi:HNH endonuclease signature motif containing protein [Streptomyces sp. NPDC001773]|uniref:HNH endonuclease signature motif containing protein n=1 Tax=Streptomyces sp. NPDC005499 TaxID=3154883 RepID=UPI0033B2F691
MRRAVLVEAGHRCAIPTCRQVPVDLAHINPWAKVKEHTFENLIALCPTCHARFDRGDIDKRSMLQYKQNLEILNSRYTDAERQFLKVSAQNWESFRRNHLQPGITLDEFRDGRVVSLGNMRIHSDMWWLLSNLLDDGIVVLGDELPTLFEQGGVTSVSLTDKGCSLVGRIVDAEPL